MVENDRVFAFVNQLLVQDIQHFQERSALVDVLQPVSFEVSLLVRTFLTPDFKRDIYVFIHDSVFLNCYFL